MKQSPASLEANQSKKISRETWQAAIKSLRKQAEAGTAPGWVVEKPEEPSAQRHENHPFLKNRPEVVQKVIEATRQFQEKRRQEEALRKAPPAGPGLQ